MKFSFEILRGANKGRGVPIQSTKVAPWHAEALRQAGRKGTRMYDAAVTTNLNADFPGTYSNANGEILSSKYVARARSRTLCKDYATMKGIQRTFKNEVCGDKPFRLEMKVGKWDAEGKQFTLETKTNREFQDAWAKFGRKENLTVRGDMAWMEFCHCCIAAVKRDGGVIVRKRLAYDGNPFGFAVQLVEEDRLDVNYMGVNPDNGNKIRFSIERDDLDKPVAYWILTRHPGDLFTYNGPNPNKWRERVPADEIIHYQNQRDRAEQDIGMPEYDAVIQELHRSRQFDIAHCYAAIRAAVKAFYITQEFPTGMPYAGDPSETMWNNTTGPAGIGSVPSPNATGNLPQGDQWGGGRNKINTLENGTAEVLDWGRKPMVLDPKFPVESAEGFQKNRLQMTASGVGLSYPSVSNDYDKVSFSTMRALEVPQRQNWMVDQQHMMDNLIFPLFAAWLPYAILSGMVKQSISRKEEFIDSAEFNGKRWGYINPMQDAQTDLILLEAGLTSPQEIRAKAGGGNIEDVYSENAEARDIAQSHDLTYQAAATLPVLQKGEPGQTNPTGQALAQGPEGDAVDPKAKAGADRSLNDLTLEELFFLHQHARDKRRETIERRTFEILRSNGH